MLELMLNTFGGQMSVFINTQAGCYFYRSAFFFFFFFFVCWQAEQAVEKALKSYIERRAKEAQVGYCQKNGLAYN